MGILKGQNFRVLLGGKVVAGSTSCTVHVAANLEECSTKDSTGGWQEQEVTGMSWDGSVDALVMIDSTDTAAIQGLNAIDLVGTTVTVIFEETNGTKNRVAKGGGVQYTGNAIINDMSQTHGNRANSTFSLQFQGVGELKKGTTESSDDEEDS